MLRDLDMVIEELRPQYPMISDLRVKAVVDEVDNGFLTQARILDFVPILVTRRAQARMSHLGPGRA